MLLGGSEPSHNLEQRGPGRIRADGGAVSAGGRPAPHRAAAAAGGAGETEAQAEAAAGAAAAGCVAAPVASKAGTSSRGARRASGVPAWRKPLKRSLRKRESRSERQGIGPNSPRIPTHRLVCPGGFSEKSRVLSRPLLGNDSTFPNDSASRALRITWSRSFSPGAEVQLSTGLDRLGLLPLPARGTLHSPVFIGCGLTRLGPLPIIPSTVSGIDSARAPCAISGGSTTSPLALW